MDWRFWTWNKRLKQAVDDAPWVAPPIDGEPSSSLRFEYFKNRLEHTVGFTHQATKNIYLVNGAVLAMTYFVSEHGSQVDDEVRRYGPSLLLFVLAIINLAHAGLLLFQAYWYRILDKGFADASGVVRPDLPAGLGTHRIFVLLHGLLGAFLLVVALVLGFRAVFFWPPQTSNLSQWISTATSSPANRGLVCCRSM